MASPPKKPLTRQTALTLVARAYDRNRERAAWGKPEPLPGHQVTRLEVVRDRFPPGSSLADLLTYSAFEDVRLSYGPTYSVWSDDIRWKTYLACRLAAGEAEAAKLMNLLSQDEKRIAHVFKTHASTLLDGISEDDWVGGLQETGLLPLLESISPMSDAQPS